MTAQSGRAYTVVVGRRGRALTGRVDREGPADVAGMLVGRPAVEAPRFAQLLFPVCPRAHAGAALGALEQAVGVALPDGQSAARQCAVLAEAVAGCVWRRALTWPQLVGASPAAVLARAARTAAEIAPTALFEGDWAAPGGAPMRLQPALLDEAVETLLDAATTPAPSDHDVLACAAQIDLAGPAAQEGAPEETPRRLMGGLGPGRRLSEWFGAQLAYTDELCRRLEAAVRDVRESAPAAADWSVDGLGDGLAATARGRLRHRIRVREGAIAHWRVTSPTDVNFAPGGAVAAALSRLSAGSNLERAAGWVAAAFDPCAPYAVTVEREPAYA